MITDRLRPGDVWWGDIWCSQSEGISVPPTPCCLRLGLLRRPGCPLDCSRCFEGWAFGRGLVHGLAWHVFFGGNRLTVLLDDSPEQFRTVQGTKVLVILFEPSLSCWFSHFFFRICQDGNSRKTEKAKQDLMKLKEAIKMTEPQYSPGLTPSARDLLNTRELEKLDVEYHKMLVARPTKWRFILAWEFWQFLLWCLFWSGFIPRPDFVVFKCFCSWPSFSFHKSSTKYKIWS